MKRIRIDFCDFSHNVSKTNLFLYKVLAERYELELCDQPDFLIYSSYGHTHRLHSGVKIYFSCESDVPNYNECDYSVAGLKVDDARHLHTPYYVEHGEAAEIIKKNDNPNEILAAKTKFCSFLVSSYNPRKNGNRVDFFQKLSKYKKVDSAGAKLNNIGGPLPRTYRAKVNFLRPYKFNICYENRALPGYTTEKIFEPMVARCLPIYWGNPLIADEFNPRSFLNRADFASDEALIEKIIELDQNDEKYLEYLREPYFYDDKPSIYFSHERILDFFEKIFTTKITPVAQRGRNGFSFGRLLGRWKLVKRHHWHHAKPPTWEA